MQSQSRLGLRWSRAIWECPDRRPSGLVSLGKSGTWTWTVGFGPVQTRSETVSGNMRMPRLETEQSSIFGKIPDLDWDRCHEPYFSSPLTPLHQPT